MNKTNKKKRKKKPVQHKTIQRTDKPNWKHCIILILLCILGIHCFFKLISNSEKYEGFDNTKKSIIIVGKAPNVEHLLKNKDNYKHIDKMALNSALHYDLDFKYYIQSDFTTPKHTKIDSGLYHKDTGITTAEENILYAKDNGINIILGQYHRYDDKGKLIEGQPPYGKIPKKVLEMNIPREIVWISDKPPLNDKMEISTYNNEKLFHQSAAGTILFTSVMYCIDKGYKNIYLSGITKQGSAGGEKSIIKYFENIKKHYSDIDIICLGMEDDSPDKFKCESIN